ncbi:MAG: 30S ribosomal protein S17e [DPANN group archaeon]|nr:30S ribosomal protein S17e [DPANN group archaeon]
MGKQRSKILRRKTEELYKMFPQDFSTDFEKNKDSLNKLRIFQSKISRNISAGYLVKLAGEEVL